MVGRQPVLLYIDASLLADGADGLRLAEELGLTTTVVSDPAELPARLDGAWYLASGPPAVGAPHWSRTVVIGPRPEPGRVAVTGLRRARDLRVAILELASEDTLD